MTQPAGPDLDKGRCAATLTRPARQVHLAVLDTFAQTGQATGPGDTLQLDPAGHHHRHRAGHRPRHHRPRRPRSGPLGPAGRGRVRRCYQWRLRSRGGPHLQLHQLLHQRPGRTHLGAGQPCRRRDGAGQGAGAAQGRRGVRGLHADRRRHRPTGWPGPDVTTASAGRAAVRRLCHAGAEDPVSLLRSPQWAGCPGRHLGRGSSSRRLEPAPCARSAPCF